MASTILLLTGVLAWNAAREFTNANQLVRINRLADDLIHCTVLVACERDVTACPR